MGHALESKRIVLTGCSRGVGLEAARQLLAAGAEVLGVARDAARLNRASEELSALGAFTSVAADLGEAAAPAKVLAGVEARWPAIDVLVNNAGVQTWTESYEAEPVELMERDLQVNVLGPHRLAKALLPLLLKGNEPRMINVSSGAGQRKVVEESSDMPAYRLGKYALNALTILQANSLKGKVAVNSLDPGWLKTDLGGPNAPGEPKDGGDRIMELLAQSSSETGRFWYGKDPIDF